MINLRGLSTSSPYPPISTYFYFYPSKALWKNRTASRTWNTTRHEIPGWRWSSCRYTTGRPRKRGENAGILIDASTYVRPITCPAGALAIQQKFFDNSNPRRLCEEFLFALTHHRACNRFISTRATTGLSFTQKLVRWVMGEASGSIRVSANFWGLHSEIQTALSNF